MYIAIAAIALLFLCPSLLWAYRKGLKDGLAINNGAKTVEPIRSPARIISDRREAKEKKADNDLIAQGMANIFGYTGDPQKKEGDS